MRGHNPRETDLAKVVVAWLADQHWDVYQEVQFRHMGGVADIVAVSSGLMWIIETKMAYGLAVLQQAAEWRAPLRSVAVPMSKSDRRDYRVARDYYRVGVLEVKLDYVYEAFPPPVLREHHRFAEEYREQLTDLHKTYAVAGSRGGAHLTPYKQTMISIRSFVEKNPGCTIKQVYDALGDMHYANRGSFTGNVVSALMSFEGDWCRVDQEVRPYRLYPRNGVQGV